MKHLSICAALLILLTCPAQLFAVPANPLPRKVNQPDGTQVTIRLFGDEWYHFFENEEGYAVMQAEDGWWVYADRDETGHYIATSFKVGKKSQGVMNFLQRVGKHLREDKKYRTEARNKFVKHTLPEIANIAEQLVVRNVVVILIQYPDFLATETPASFNDMMNQVGYNGIGSFRDFYLENSYGNFTVNATVVTQWFTAPHNRSYYAWRDLNHLNRSKELVRSAVDLADAFVNYANFDDDGDGDVDAVFIVHAGPGAEEYGGDLTNIWSHRNCLSCGSPNLSVTHDGKLINDYIIMPEKYQSGHVKIGVFCHEYGHILGLPDLYDLDGSSSGIGFWSVMSSGSWGVDWAAPGRPTHFDAWCKSKRGWVSPTVIDANTTGSNIPQVETNPVVYRLWTNGQTGSEYFLLENRQQVSFDRDLPVGGLAIWHVYDRMLNNQDESCKLVDLEEAHGGAQHLDMGVNEGDAGDLFPGSFGNRNFNGGTDPNSNNHTDYVTHICVDSISPAGTVMTANFCVTHVEPPDVMIRDCPSDIGAEPDVACQSDFCRSPDIWIDNNDDGIIDEPIQGQINHLYVRVSNVGGLASNVNVRCYYIDPSLGLLFPGSGTQIVDAVSGSGVQTISILPHILPPDPSASVHFNWNIPTPPPYIDHYCIGCIASAATDTQTSEIPVNDNNLAQINYMALAQKKGQRPLNQTRSDWGDSTVFLQRIKIGNPLGYREEFYVTAISDSSLPWWWYFDYDADLFYLDSGEVIERTIRAVDYYPIHGESLTIRFQLRTYPSHNIVGELIYNYRIDDCPPDSVSDFSVQRYELPPDNFPPNPPTVELTWTEPRNDTCGSTERVRFYYIYRSTQPNLVFNDTSLIDSTGLDLDPKKAGYQWWDYVNSFDSTYYYGVIAVDLAHSKGRPSLPTTYHPKYVYPLNFGVRERWNMVSVPLKVADYLKTHLFPPAISRAFAYEGGYEAKDTLVNGKGYWLKFGVAQSILLSGEFIVTDTIDLSQGWNMIGSLSVSVPISTIISDPPNMITSEFYGYEKKYITADTIYPGKGYWVKVRQSGKLILSANTLSGTLAKSAIHVVPIGELPPPPPEDHEITQPRSVPAEFALRQTYPNPFNPTTIIEFDLPIDASVTLKVFNLLGQEIMGLEENEQYTAGTHQVEFDATDLPTGVYFYRITAQGKERTFTDVKKMILVR